MYCLATDMNVLDTDHDRRWLAKMSGQQPSQRNGNRSLGEVRGNQYPRMRTYVDANDTSCEEATGVRRSMHRI